MSQYPVSQVPPFSNNVNGLPIQVPVVQGSAMGQPLLIENVRHQNDAFLTQQICAGNFRQDYVSEQPYFVDMSQHIASQIPLFSNNVYSLPTPFPTEQDASMGQPLPIDNFGQQKDAIPTHQIGVGNFQQYHVSLQPNFVDMSAMFLDQLYSCDGNGLPNQQPIPQGTPIGQPLPINNFGHNNDAFQTEQV
eukprot:247735_1